MMKKWFWVLVAIVLFFPVYYIGKVVWIKKIGITLSPSKKFSNIPVDYFFLRDPKWASAPLGTSQYTIGDSGCLVACIASVVNHMGKQFTLNQLNEIFTKEGVYNAHGDVIWFKISQALPSIDYYYQRAFSTSTIEKDLQSSQLPIVKVKNFRSGRYHWVVIVGANENDFLVMDSLNQDKACVPLKTYGKVYAYRKKVVNAVP